MITTKKNLKKNTKNTKNKKITKTIDLVNSDKSTDDNDLLLLLTEADKITLNDLDFDNILKEQSKMLCNINNIVNKEGEIKGQIKSKNKDNNPLCNIINTNNDSKFKSMLSNYKKKLISKSKISKTRKIHKPTVIKSLLKKTKTKKSFKKINLVKHKPTSINYTSKKSTHKKSRSKKSRSRKSRSRKSRSRKTTHKKSTHKKSTHKKSRHRKSNNKKKCILINKLAFKNKNVYRYNNRRKFDVTITNPQIYIKNNSKNKDKNK